jgi:hypothetical protein
MPNGPSSVSLDVSNVSKPGYTSTTASNGSAYFYKFTGGNTSSDNGDVEYKVNGGQAAITVSLVSGSPYTITGEVTFDPDTPQLSSRSSSNTVRVITDTAVAVGDFKYTVTVNDSTANCTIPCDPLIKNKT